MLRSEVESLFEKYKDSYLRGKKASIPPTAYILGGQPAAGKSGLANIISRDTNILQINGDLYRIHHPNHLDLFHDTNAYSVETQLFSSVFTEGLIREAIERELAVSVEGTMRSSEVVQDTISLFKRKDYRVELMCIAAPSEFTAINLYVRYAQELSIKGVGRLADIEIHDIACDGLLTTLDEAYKLGSVDRICLFSAFGTTVVEDYQKKRGCWSNTCLPSVLVQNSRRQQLLNPTLVKMFWDKGNLALDIIQDTEVKAALSKRLQDLKKKQSLLRKHLRSRHNRL